MVWFAIFVLCFAVGYFAGLANGRKKYAALSPVTMYPEYRRVPDNFLARRFSFGEK